jgi:alkylmercury lyase
MTAPTTDQLVAAWTSRAATRRVGVGDACHRAALRLLADGRPVAPTAIAESYGLPVADVEVWLGRMRACGYELDDHGRLVGAALTLRETGHRFRVRGHDLYAWCGFDTLFLPILLDEAAEVASTCPATGRPIELQVAADGTVTHATPSTTVVAAVGPEVLDACPTVGPGTPICDQMPLLADPDAAHRWATDRDGVAIVALPAATELARAYVRHSCC